MTNPSDKSPTGAAESNRERAREQSASKLHLNKETVRDLEVPESEAVKGGGIPKRPTGGGDDY